MQEQLNFLKIALKDHQIGAMTRSSKYVVRAVVKGFPKLPLKRVLEYGPGDGVVTREILKRMPKDGEIIAIETNPVFIKVLKAINDPRLKVINGKAQKILLDMRRDNRSDIDLVVSSIPLTILDPDERETIVADTSKILKENGRFIVFQYSPLLLKVLSKYFNKKNIKTRFEIRNVPPMFIMCAQKVS